jgi:small GTP-binding protein
LWDLAGEDEVSPIRASYLRGAAGYFLVVDGTRPDTLDTAASIRRRVASEIGDIPFLLLLNKADMQDDWALPPERLEATEAAGWHSVRTSARTGQGVEEAFQELATRMVM